MSEHSEVPSPEEKPGASSGQRCPECDSVVSPGESRCLMCGANLAGLLGGDQAGLHENDGAPARREQTQKSGVARAPGRLLAQDEETESAGDASGRLEAERALTSGTGAVVESPMRERRSGTVMWLTFAFAVVIGLSALTLIRYPINPAVALFPTATQAPPTVTLTPTWTPLPTEAGEPTETATITLTPLPTNTPSPPRLHTVTSGETLFGLGLRYDVSAESIAESNGLSVNASIQVSQQLLIPWPTATPPLAPVQLELGGEVVVADPTDCEMYEISSGDTLFGIAARTRIDLRAILEVNRLTERSILQPGDAICIPQVIRGGILPPTPGPSPTASPTRPPEGPVLLYPVEGAEIEPPDARVLLQWSAVKSLAEEEWYMVEVTDLSDVDGHPRRAFTRQTSFTLPDSWRPSQEEVHRMRWRVSIVRVTGERADGSFVYTFGGASSEMDEFFWLGAEPTSTPEPTPPETPLP